MQFSWTIFKYFSKLYARWMLGVLFAFSFVVIVADYIELFRRTRNKQDIGFGLVTKLVLYHLPNTVQQLMPFVILFSVMLFFWRFGRSQQLVILRASGVSIWKMLLPIVSVVGVYLILDFTVLNPLGASFMNRFEQIDNMRLRGKKNAFSIASTGLWLRQKENSGYALVRIARVSPMAGRLDDITIYNLSDDDTFLNRIDARVAKVEAGMWRLQDATVSTPNVQPRRHQIMDWETSLALSSIENQFLSPDTLSFWELPKFIRMLDNAGLSSVKHRIYWYDILARPLFLLAMVILGALCSYRAMQRNASLFFVIMGIGGAFCVYIFYSVVKALGITMVVPVPLATLIPAMMCLMLMLFFMLHLEETL